MGLKIFHGKNKKKEADTSFFFLFYLFYFTTSKVNSNSTVGRKVLITEQ